MIKIEMHYGYETVAYDFRRIYKEQELDLAIYPDYVEKSFCDLNGYKSKNENTEYFEVWENEYTDTGDFLRGIFRGIAKK